LKEHIKERIVETALKACGEKLFTGTSGNLSEYDRENRLMLITPSGLDYTIMKSADIVIMDLDGKIMEGKLKPSSEWRLHAELYRALDHVNAIIHTHSPFATAFAVLHESIPLVLTAMLQYPGGEVPLAEYAPPGTEQVGINALNAMRNRNCYCKCNCNSNCCLLANHGVVAAGTTLEEAYLRALYTEDAAKVYHLARQIGKPVPLPVNA